MNPEENIQAYLKRPEPSVARWNVVGKALVSGLVRSKDRTDQYLFDLLNNQDSLFEFEKIVAFVDDTKFAKKRLLSRSARYTGLLDKLDFKQAANPGSFPTSEDLDGINNWVAVLDGEDLVAGVKEIASIAKSTPCVQNVAILLANAVDLDLQSCKDAVDSLQGHNFTYTLVAVGKLEDHPEGKYTYNLTEFGTEDGVLKPDSVFSRDEAMRMITECLQLVNGANRTLTFSEVRDNKATEAKLIKGLRAAGYTRPQEIDHILQDGFGKYRTAIEEFKVKYPNAGKGVATTEAWWEAEEFQKVIKKQKDREEAEKNLLKDERTKEIESIAKAWVKREYFRQTMAGTIDDKMTEEAFSETVWDRAMFEADLKFRKMNGEVVDPENELISFKTKQDRKKQVMLDRAKEDLQRLLDEEDLGGEDFKERLDSIEPRNDGPKK